MRSDVHTAWFGLSGIHGADGANLLAPHLLSIAREVSITNDAEFALAGLDSGPGVALIAGTGSIALGRDASGEIIQVGGWGHLLGDEGSAYDIGRRAAQAAARAADGRGPSTALLQLVLERWGLTTPRQMIEHIYLTQEKAPIASLAPGVLQMAKRGDHVARAIRRHACEELAQAAITVIDTLNLAEPVPLIFGGGLLIHEREFRAALVARIRRRRALGRVTLVKEPALWAARSLAARGRAAMASAPGRR
jgi:N-acetylglucosamine kinase-like BadF-type ATPase